MAEDGLRDHSRRPRHPSCHPVAHQSGAKIVDSESLMNGIAGLHRAARLFGDSRVSAPVNNLRVSTVS
jgi:hypothetical protein